MLTPSQVTDLIRSDTTQPSTRTMEFTEPIPLMTLLELDLNMANLESATLKWSDPKSAINKVLINRIKLLMDHLTTKAGRSMRDRVFRQWTVSDSQRFYDEYLDGLTDHDLRDTIKANYDATSGTIIKFTESKPLLFCLQLDLHFGSFHSSPRISISNLKSLVNRLSTNKKRRFVLTNPREIPTTYHPSSFGCFDLPQWTIGDSDYIHDEFINRSAMIKRIDRLRKPSGRTKKINRHWIPKFTCDNMHDSSTCFDYGRKCPTCYPPREFQDPKQMYRIVASVRDDAENIMMMGGYGTNCLSYPFIPIIFMDCTDRMELYIRCLEDPSIDFMGHRYETRHGTYCLPNCLECRGFSFNKWCPCGHCDKKSGVMDCAKYLLHHGDPRVCGCEKCRETIDACSWYGDAVCVCGTCELDNIKCEDPDMGCWLGNELYDHQRYRYDVDEPVTVIPPVYNPDDFPPL